MPFHIEGATRTVLVSILLLIFLWASVRPSDSGLWLLLHHEGTSKEDNICIKLFPGCAACAAGKNASLRPSASNCPSRLWTHVRNSFSDAFAAVVDCMCDQVGRDELDALVPPEQRARIVRDIASSSHLPLRQMWRKAFADIRRTTFVDVLLSSFNRPSHLYLTLSSLRTMVMGEEDTHIHVHILWEATLPEHAAAYEVVQQAYRGDSRMSFVERGALGGFAAAIERVRTLSNATNFVILSDDSLFIRPTDLHGLAALQRTLACSDEKGAPQYTISVETRLSARFVGEEDPANILPAGAHDGGYFFGSVPGEAGIPPAQLARSSKCYNAHLPGGGHLCYNRHIDGPMFLATHLQREWPRFARQPQNPGDLEGIWMQLKGSCCDEYSLYALDQALVNAGMQLATVRKDREHLEDASSLNAKREEERRSSIAFAHGCRQNSTQWLTADFLQSVDVLRAVPPLPWSCPDGIDPPV
jgi:hypothetical protein